MVYLEGLEDLEAPVKTQATSGASLGSSAGRRQHCSTARSSWIRMQEIVTEVKEKSIKTWSPDPSNQQHGSTPVMWSWKRSKGTNFQKTYSKGPCPGGRASTLGTVVRSFHNFVWVWQHTHPKNTCSPTRIRVHLGRGQSSAVDQWELCMSAAVTLGLTLISDPLPYAFQHHHYAWVPPAFLSAHFLVFIV